MNQRYQGYPQQPATQQNTFIQESYQGESPPFYPPNNYYPNYASEPPQQAFNPPLPPPPPPPPPPAQPQFVHPGPNLLPNALPRYSDIPPPPPPPRMGHIQRPSAPFRHDSVATPFRRESEPTPFRQDSVATPFRQDSVATPFRQDSIATPFRQDSVATPFRQDSVATPFRQDSVATPFRQDPVATPFRQDSEPTPFQQESVAAQHFPTSGYWRAPIFDPTSDTKQGQRTPESFAASNLHVEPHENAAVASVPLHAADNAEKENSVQTKLKCVEDVALSLVPPELQDILKELMQPLFCKLCNAFLNAPNQAQQHYSGKSHAKRVKLFLKEVKKEEPTVSKTEGFSDNELKSEVAVESGKESTGKEMKPVLTDSLVAKDTSNPAGNKMVTAEEYCDLCDASFNSPKQAEQHYKGKNHAKKLRLSASANEPLTCDSSVAGGEGSKFTCFVCDVHVTSQGQLTSHLNGSRHKNKLRVQQRGSQALRGRWTNKQDTVRRSSTGGLESDLPPGICCEQNTSDFSPGYSDWQLPSPAKKSRRDFSNNRTPSGKYYCSACNVTLNAEGQFAQHVESRRHKSCNSSQRNYLDGGDLT